MVINNEEWSQANIHYLNVLDIDNNTPTSFGYLVLRNGSPYQDPYEGDQWLSTCISSGVFVISPDLEHTRGIMAAGLHGTKRGFVLVSFLFLFCFAFSFLNVSK